MTYIRSRKHAVASIGMGAASLLMLAATSANAADAATSAADAAVATADADAPKAVAGVDVTSTAHYKAPSENVKATASILDTPKTVTVIGAQLMQEQGATTLSEALRNSAGVGTFSMGENGTTNTGDAVFIRGSDISGSLLIDGVRDVGSVFRDIFNVEQIEVLKGGAGSEIGRGAATGAINTFTKQPNQTQRRSVSAIYGSGDFMRATADVNWVLSDSSAFRLNAVVQDAGVPGRDEVENNRWGIAPSLAFGLGTSTRYYIDYMHVKQDNVPDGGVSTVGLSGYQSPDPVNRPFLSTAKRVNSSNFYGTKDDHDDVSIDAATFIVEHEFSDNFSIRNLSRWSSTDQNYQLSSMNASSTNLQTPNPNDPSTWTIARTVTNKDITNSALYNGTNLRAQFATGPISHTVTAGLEFIRERQKTRAYVGTGAYPAVNLYNPQINVSGYSRALSGAYTLGTTDTIGAYINDNIALTDTLFFNGGLRVDSYDTTFDSVAVGNVKTTLDASDDLFSGSAGLVWKPLEQGSVYASYATTKQPPGGANFSLSTSTTGNVNNPRVEPQTAKNSEIGSKWELFGRRLLVSGALYKTTYSDQIAQDADGSFYRTGRKRVSGVELAAQGQITAEWAINAGYTTMNTKVSGTAVTADGTAVLAYSPDKAFTLWTTYQLPMGVTVGGGTTYNGDMKRASDGAVGTPKLSDGYWVWNGLVSYEVREGVDLQLNVYNLLDEDYVASINKSGFRYTPGAPRSAKLALNVAF